MFFFLSYTLKYSIQIGIDAVKMVMLSFIVISLVSTLVSLLVYKFKPGRLYSFYLITVYIVFLTLALLVSQNIL